MKTPEGEHVVTWEGLLFAILVFAGTVSICVSVKMIWDNNYQAGYKQAMYEQEHEAAWKSIQANVTNNRGYSEDPTDLTSPNLRPAPCQGWECPTP